MSHPDWRAVQTENPTLTIGQVTFLGEGWGARAYRVNDTLVMKFPKRAELWEVHSKEFALLTYLQSRLPLAIPQPHLQRQHSAGWPHGYLAYSFVPGVPLDLTALAARQRDAAAETLGEFVRTLHAAEPDEQLRALLPRYDRASEFQEIFQLAEARVFPQLSEQDAALVRRGALAYLENPNNFAFTPTLIHADLHSDHLLTQNGVMTGIIDFDTAALGDPDSEFSDFLEEFGEAFVCACATAYGHPDPEALIDKLRRRSLFSYLHDILYGPEFGLPDDAANAWAGLRGWAQQSA